MHTATHLPTPTSTPPQRWTRFASYLEIAEFVFGSIIWFAAPLAVVSLTAIGLIQMWTERRESQLTLPLTLVWVVAIVPLEFVTGRFFNRRIERSPIPAPADFALEQPAYPWPLRPLAAAWWLMHFAIIVLGTQWIIAFYRQHMDSGYMPGIGGWTMAIGLTFASTAAAHFFLVLAVAAMTRHRPLVQALWASRWLIEVAITAALMLSPVREAVEHAVP